MVLDIAARDAARVAVTLQRFTTMIDAHLWMSA
jgi:hypothetical protein